MADCAECGRTFDGPQLEVLCPTCDAIEQAGYEAAYVSLYQDSRRTVMQERLGVSGDVDE
jgi:hypothetical protein